MLAKPKRTVKVSYQGETKRLKLSDSYSELVERTRTAFKNLPVQIKFFYLDEDNEIISISSQSDYTEALEIEDFAALRFTVAPNASDARQQLLAQLEESRPLAESLNQSQILSSSIGRQSTIGRGGADNFLLADSDFDAMSHGELGQSIRPATSSTGMNTQTTAAHTIAVGPDSGMSMKASVSTGTDAVPQTHKTEAGCNTARVQTSEKMIDTCVRTHEMSSQAHTQVRDMGSDSIVVDMHNQTTQMEVEMKEADVTCDLLIPEDSDENAADLEEVTCIKCNGSQMNKKGLPCRKCNGRGTLVSRELSTVASLVRQEVQEFCYESFRKMFTDYLNEKQIEQDSTVHERIICDGCQIVPIIGVRYMSSVQADTDFCEKCERSGIHSHAPLLKVRRPGQAPKKMICQYRNNQINPQPVPNPLMKGMQMPKSAPGSQWERNPAAAQPTESQKNVRYSARFVKESFPEKHEIMTGDLFCKSWWMRNDGETAWPAGTQLVQTSGDNINAKVVTFRREIKPDETFEISVQCQAPEKEGRYVAFFRLQTGRIKFGHKISCDILCVEPKAAIVCPEDILIDTCAKPEQPVQMVSQEVAGDKDMADSDAAGSLLNKSVISIDVKSPKQLYFEQVEAESCDYQKQSLTALYDFGFTCFAVNKALMQKHNDVNKVAETLMSGALSESQFGAINFN